MEQGKRASVLCEGGCMCFWRKDDTHCSTHPVKKRIPFGTTSVTHH